MRGSATRDPYSTVARQRYLKERQIVLVNTLDKRERNDEGGAIEKIDRFTS